MRFSKRSQDTMNFFINDVDKFLQKQNAHQQRQLDITLNKIYKDIYNSDVFVSNLFSRRRILKRQGTIMSIKDIPTTSLMSSPYIPNTIRNDIQIYSKKYHHYSCKIFTRSIDIYIISMKKDIHIKLCDDIVRKMLTWLRMAFIYSPSFCGKNIKILLFWTTFKKELPSEVIKIIDTENCNSAVTFGCAKNGEIIIYRQEEWFKVFIHETFHALGLDFSTFSCSHLDYKIRKIFPLNSEFNLYEAYSEFWATIINCSFCAFELLDNKLSETDFLLYCDFCIQFERIFSLFQLVKILHFMGLTYKNLYEKTDISDVARNYLYKEKTNVFSYYIIKTILLYNYSSFLHWCDRHNINTIRFDNYDHNLVHFFNFIQSKYDKKIFLDDFNSMKSLYYTTKMSNDSIYKTMRMTVCELE